MKLNSWGLLASLCFTAAAKKPNIVFILTDDQDYRLGSLNHQKVLQEQIISKGTLATQHYATISICCPSRVSLLRGQAAHNTNNTHVLKPGGGYEKFQLAGLDKDSLPHWLAKAGHQAEYIGKLMNGLSIRNYSPPPSGWHHIDALLDPYSYIFNTVVMSMNGERSVYYDGFHQSDVIRIKALDRLNRLIDNGEPWFLGLAPTSPHTQGPGPPVPCSRYNTSFPNATAPQTPNFNPSDEFQRQKTSWVKQLPRTTDEQIETANTH